MDILYSGFQSVTQRQYTQIPLNGLKLEIFTSDKHSSFDDSLCGEGETC